MRAVAAFFTAVSSFSIALAFAAPSVPSLTLCSHFDTNTHTTQAETPLPTSLPLRPRGNPHPIYVSAANTRIYVVLRAVAPLAGTAIHNLLVAVYDTLEMYLRTMADVPIAGGGIDMGSRYYVKASNANNHQITYGVLCEALQAMANWMSANGDAMVRFEIWDGDNLVGKGIVGIAGGVVRRRVE